MGLLRSLRNVWELTERVDECIKRIDEFQHVIEELDHEWTAWHEKYSTLYARLAKRAKQIERHEEQERGEGATLAPAPVGTAGYAQRLAAARQRYGSNNG